LQTVRGTEDATQLQSMMEMVGDSTAVAFDLQLSAKMSRDPFQMNAAAAAHSPLKV
jgi:hypothetical protein